jgi:DNA-binding NarL/FixJ family response regulator
LILTRYDTDAYVFGALQVGASCFVLKDAGSAEPLHAICMVAGGEASLALRITRRLVAQFAVERITTDIAEDRLAVLTQRERQVLAPSGTRTEQPRCRCPTVPRPSCRWYPCQQGDGDPGRA